MCFLESQGTLGWQTRSPGCDRVRITSPPADRPPIHRLSQCVTGELPRLRGLPIQRGSLGSLRGRPVPPAQVEGEITRSRPPFCFERPRMKKI
ncbi:hypothetical protein NDU88_005787 [Pleurodeles waltl]|uniref:Uncharacterized protein n=1 Tax=Pleurodeles waltl TaxID=8319 RepID=A0AAV7LNM3_PLEWA|nr:hypothetical protein NDU88_005787 [Pleurodeles waltl]